jgi:hypothetical protein
MAGSYPDVPGYRFAYDVDGSLVTSNEGVTLATASVRALNSESNTTNITGTDIVMIFPENRDISGIYVRRNSGTTAVATGVFWSDDTVSGVDGTWHSYGNILSSTTHLKEGTRTDIRPVEITNAKALRLSINTWLHRIHLYGSISTEQSPDRLRVIDLTNDSTTSDGSTATGSDISSQLDFGNVLQSGSITRQFKVLNNSTAKTASDITVGLNTISDAAPSIIGQYQVSSDNTAYANSINIGNLGPGEESQVLYIRMNVLSNAQLSTWNARIVAHAVSWS